MRVDRIGDNTKNVQAACAQSKVRVLSCLFMQNNFFQGFSLNCLAHSAHVLMQDCVKLFERQFNQAKDIELFFKNRYHPRVSYKAFMKPGDTHLIQVFGAGLTFLSFLFLQCVDIRWGSAIDCLQSVVQNRTVLEEAIGDLQRQEFEFKANELVCIFHVGWW